MGAAAFIAALAAILLAVLPDLAHAQDSDGYGIPDASDPCPSFFNVNVAYHCTDG